MAYIEVQVLDAHAQQGEAVAKVRKAQMFQTESECARWRVIYDLIEPLGLNDVITYQRMGIALGLDPGGQRHLIQGAMRKAQTEYLKLKKHALVAVPNMGYRVIEPQEQVTLARKHQKKSSRSLGRGHAVAANVDLSKVDDATRNALDMVARAFSLQMEFNRRFDVRQQRLEAALATVADKAEKSEQELEDLRERLSRLESAI